MLLFITQGKKEGIGGGEIGGRRTISYLITPSLSDRNSINI